MAIAGRRIEIRPTLRDWRESRTEVSVEVRDGALVLDEAEVSLEGTRVYLQPVAGVEDMRLCFIEGDEQARLLLEMPDEASAHRLLRELGMAPETRMVFRAVRTPVVMGTFLSVILGVATVGGFFETLGLVAITFAIPWLVLALILRLKFFFYPVEVGPEGVRVRERFIAYEGIEKVAPLMSSELELVLSGGEKVTLNFPTDERSAAMGWKAGREGVRLRDAVRHGIESAMRRRLT